MLTRNTGLWLKNLCIQHLAVLKQHFHNRVAAYLMLFTMLPQKTGTELGYPTTASTKTLKQ